jgi:bifunctional DNA-binding transcriptional regulator/antitoxin component of YhaV-PrlF toxin-antitoxin module
MSQVVIQIGNSEGLILPKDVRNKTGLKKGVKFYIEITPDNRVVIGKVGSKKGKVSSVTPEFAKMLEEVNDRYGPALKKLAKL